MIIKTKAKAISIARNLSKRPIKTKRTDYTPQRYVVLSIQDTKFKYRVGYVVRKEKSAISYIESCEQLPTICWKASVEFVSSHRA